MSIKEFFLQLLFPSKCILCEKPLLDHENDLCKKCRSEVETFTKADHRISFVAGWTAMWYYNDKVRESLLRYKFQNHRNHGIVYGKMLAMKLLTQPLCDFDMLSWVPVSQKRYKERGFDQSEIIARAMADELQCPVTPVLVKTRHTRPQSGLSDASHRRANIIGAYQVVDPQLIADKKILLIDDIITTGATASECAKTLLIAGAKEVYCAAVAAPNHKNKQRR